MVRCPTCGVRLRDAEPSCPRHGPVSVQRPAAPAEPEPAASEADPVFPGYVLGRVLGRGGFGTVWAATRERDRAEVAIKLAIKTQVSAVERLVLEIDALRRIGPPCVPEVFDSGTLPDGSTWVAMAYVKAPTLASRLEEVSGPLELPEFLELGRRLCDVIGAVADHGLVHCDLKPENVFLLPDRMVLFDFGLVREAGKPVTAVAATGPVGTPEYMAPEQCAAEDAAVLDARADVYALGVMLFELLTGAPPFLGSAADVQEAHRARRPPRPSVRVSVPAAIDDVVVACLTKDPARRIASVAAVRTALETAGGTSVAAPASAPVPAPTTPKKAAAGAGREKRTVGLVWFHTQENLGALQAMLGALTGQLAHARGTEYVAVFGHEVGDNPTRSAMYAARELLAKRVVERAIVDVAAVAVQARPDGSRRFVSPLFGKKERFPQDSDPQGVLFTEAAAQLLTDLPTEPVPERPGLLRAQTRHESTQVTSIRRSEQPFVGHENLRKTLLASARKAAQANPTLVTMVADAGLGKSQLASALIETLQHVRPQMQILGLRAPERVGEIGNEALRDLLRRALDLPFDRPDDRGARHLRERLGEEVAAGCALGIAIAMDWVEADDPELRRLQAAPGALRSAVAGATGRVLRALALEQPLALILDDAHFADDLLLDAIEHATMAEHRAPVWACVLARPQFTAGRTTWGTRAGEHSAVDLPPLDNRSAEELARSLLKPATAVPHYAIAKLVQRTQGIPLLLVELVRGLKRDGLVRQNEQGRGWYLATDELENLPDLPQVQWLATREFEALPAQLAGHARLAALLGPTFSTDEIEGVLAELERSGSAVETDLDAAVGVQRLIEAGLVVRHRTGRLGFRHSLLRDTVYETLPQHARAEGHAAAFRMYHQRETLPESERLPYLAYHADRSGNREEAARAYLLLAARTQARHSYLEAEINYKHALANLAEEDRARRMVAVQGSGLMRFRLGRNDDAVKDLALASEYARALGDRDNEIAILLDAATVQDWLSNFGESLRLVEQAQALAGEHPTPLLEARLLMGLGRSRMRHSDYEGATPLMLQAMERATALGEDGYETYVIAGLMAAPGQAVQGQIDAALAVLDEVRIAAEQHADHLHRAVAFQNRTWVWMLSQQYDRALEDTLEVVRIGREIGVAVLENRGVRNVSEIRYWLGKYGEAEEDILRAIELSTQLLGERSDTLVCRLLHARICFVAGDALGARTEVETVRRLRAEIRVRGQTDEVPPSDACMGDMLELALDGGSEQAWRDLVERSQREAVESDRLEVLEFWGLAATAAGQADLAREAFQRAVAYANEIGFTPTVWRIRAQLDALDAAAPTGTD